MEDLNYTLDINTVRFKETCKELEEFQPWEIKTKVKKCNKMIVFKNKFMAGRNHSKNRKIKKPLNSYRKKLLAPLGPFRVNLEKYEMSSSEYDSMESESLVSHTSIPEHSKCDRLKLEKRN